MRRIRSLIGQHWSIISYLIFGALTTLVNFLVYFPLLNWLGWSGYLSNILAWIVSVAFAFLTNKPFVFKSHDWSLHTVLPELSKFIGCRVGSGLFETLMIWLLVDHLQWNGNWIKIIVSIVVVVLNYISSKLIVFRESKSN